MTTTYKVLGQVAPAATTETDLYTVPASISVNGAATANKDYMAYDLTIGGNGYVAFTIGATMDSTDKIRVYASTANLSFAVFGSELT